MPMLNTTAAGSMWQALPRKSEVAEPQLLAHMGDVQPSRDATNAVLVKRAF